MAGPPPTETAQPRMGVDRGLFDRFMTRSEDELRDQVAATPGLMQHLRGHANVRGADITSALRKLNKQRLAMLLAARAVTH
jgi:hypothetical protein